MGTSASTSKTSISLTGEDGTLTIEAWLPRRRRRPSDPFQIIKEKQWTLVGPTSLVVARSNSKRLIVLLHTILQEAFGEGSYRGGERTLADIRDILRLWDGKHT